jgi:hypothetical protein
MKPNQNEKLIRALHVETKIVDKKKGIVKYIASDESLDSYREIVRAAGWRFDRFEKNAPFVDSHDYSTIGKLLGGVIDYEVKKNQLEETVQWALEAEEENPLIRIGWKMTVAGYLKAVSVGFIPMKWVSRWDSDRTGYLRELSMLGMTEDEGPRVIYLEQQQIELSAVIIGANGNAVAKAFKSGAIDEEDLEALEKKLSQNETKTVPAADSPAPASRTKGQVAIMRELITALLK